jgi:hypothetical protein
MANESSGTQWQGSSATEKSGLDLSRLVLLGLGLAVGALVVHQWPELRRYMKMRSM